jgi:hypothetical protein
MAFERQLSINKGVGFHNISILGEGYNQSSKLQQKHAGRTQTVQSINLQRDLTMAYYTLDYLVSELYHLILKK